MSQRRFVVAATDEAETLLLPSISERLGYDAPGCTIEVVPPSRDDATALELGTLDLRVSRPCHLPSDELVVTPLWTDPLVVVGHPNLRDAARSIHAGILAALEATGFDGPGPRRTTTHFAALQLAAQTSAFAIVPRRVAERYLATTKLQLTDLAPLDVHLELRSMWHPNHRSDAAHQWFRALVAQAATTLATQA
ncbi:MAG: LysR substrate-binding domain-containing protein [Nannocystales bacterium]